MYISGKKPDKPGPTWVSTKKSMYEIKLHQKQADVFFRSEIFYAMLV